MCVRCQFPISEDNQDREDDALRLVRVNECDWASSDSTGLLPDIKK